MIWFLFWVCNIEFKGSLITACEWGRDETCCSFMWLDLTFCMHTVHGKPKSSFNRLAYTYMYMQARNSCPQYAFLLWSTRFFSCTVHAYTCTYICMWVPSHIYMYMYVCAVCVGTCTHTVFCMWMHVEILVLSSLLLWNRNISHESRLIYI